MPNSIVILTGAGISAESGIKTFRDANGLWENHRVEEVASPAGFSNNPDVVHQFYNQRRRQLLSQEVQANSAHIALAKLEAHFAGDFLLVTQNVDDLHERAGSKKLVHIHGEILKKRCNQCGTVSEALSDLTTTDVCSDCQYIGSLRPHIVWFGEMPMEMQRIHSALRGCDLFVAIGTSGNVYPAAGFVEVAKHSGAKTHLLNLDESQNGTEFDTEDYGLATEIVPPFVEHLLAST